MSATTNPRPPAWYPPYGGTLVDLFVDEARADALKAESRNFTSLTLDDRGLCDLELLAVGGYSPLAGFLGREDYERVIAEGRLVDGHLWPLPVVLPVTPGEGIAEGETVGLRDVYGNLLAVLHIDELYAYDRAAEAASIYGTTEPGHPGVAQLARQADHYAAGRLEVIRVPPHYDFVDLRRTPAELRAHFAAIGWSKAVFTTHDPLRRVEEERARRAAEQVGGGLLIHPIVGVTRPGDIDHFTRLRGYRALLAHHFTPGTAVLNLLPYVSRVAGAKDALLLAIIRRNYGGTHAVVDRNHPLRDHADALGLTTIDAPPLAYLINEDRFVLANEVPPGARTADLSEGIVPEVSFDQGLPLPSWFARPAVAAIFQEAHPPRHRQGLTLWFTGLSGSGKSTVAHALIERLAEHGRNCALLDGDEIRTHLSKGLGFSKEDRDLNIRRVGYVAGMVNQAGGTVLCSVISPYRRTRDEARKSSRGNFVEIYCATPLEVCERRDVKGLYAKAKAAVAEGKPMGFTGIDDPYEPSPNPEVTLDTSQQGVAECVDAIVARLRELGYIPPESSVAD